jgi:16S rRNA (cytosine1402-N4)-methyltransferase
VPLLFERMPETKAENLHTSVLLDEAVDILNAIAGGTFVDATLGMGGHAEKMLSMTDKSIVIGIDQDDDALDKARERLTRFGDRVTFIHSNFSEIGSVVRDAGVEAVEGVIADLGVSSLQLDSTERGFSFRFDAQLDMRMDTTSGMPTAAELLATLPEIEIANIIYQYGEERFSRRIARRIVEKRAAGTPIETTHELVALIERSVRRNPKDKIHPATRTFQALRIAVNDELKALEKFIVEAIDILKTDGRLAIITFHSLEDRIVKRAFQKMSGKCFCPPRIPQCVCGAIKVVEILTRKPIVPGEEELADNVRSRSAKLRAVRKIEIGST